MAKIISLDHVFSKRELYKHFIWLSEEPPLPEGVFVNIPCKLKVHWTDGGYKRCSGLGICPYCEVSKSKTQYIFNFIHFENGAMKPIAMRLPESAVGNLQSYFNNDGMTPLLRVKCSKLKRYTQYDFDVVRPLRNDEIAKIKEMDRYDLISAAKALYNENPFGAFDEVPCA